MFGSLYNEFAILLMISIVFGYFAIRLYQPLILAFIVVGVVSGPSVLGWVTATSEIDLLSKVGVTLLLFIVGLKLDFHLIRTLGAVSLAAGLGQVIFTSAIGYLIGLMFGFSHVTAIYVAVALTFSSTIIIVKLLTDKDEIDSLYGRIAIGFLIVQDIVAILAIIILSSLNVGEANQGIGLQMIYLIIKGVSILAMVGLLMRYILPFILSQIAQSKELLVLFAIGWAVALAGITDILGFSKEVGGFLAGISLASTQYRDALSSRLETLRNFLLLFFFLDLGTKLQFDILHAQVVPAITFSLFVLIGNPIIVMIIMGYMGYRNRTGFLAGLTVAQISEFSLVLAALGQSLGHIDANTVALITLVGILTIALSTYMILYSHILYAWLGRWLTLFERKIAYSENMNGQQKDENFDVIIFGFGRYGSTIATRLKDYGLRILAVDFDPQKIKSKNGDNLVTRYGDADDVEFTKSLPLMNTKWVLSTIPRVETNQVLISALHENHYAGKIALSAFNPHELVLVDKIKADLVLKPYSDAAVKAAQKLAKIILGDQYERRDNDVGV